MTSFALVCLISDATATKIGVEVECRGKNRCLRQGFSPVVCVCSPQEQIPIELHFRWVIGREDRYLQQVDERVVETLVQEITDPLGNNNHHQHRHTEREVCSERSREAGNLNFARSAYCWRPRG